jgi:transcriptional regulator with XRE-family HTH domain
MLKVVIIVPKQEKSIFANRLVELRKSKNLTQYKLASELGFSRGLIANYEQGTREPDYNMLKIIADFFGVSTDWLLGHSTSDQDENYIINTISNNPELLDFTRELMERESMQLLFKQAKSLPDAEVIKIIKIIKAIEDEENTN